MLWAVGAFVPARISSLLDVLMSGMENCNISFSVWFKLIFVLTCVSEGIVAASDVFYIDRFCRFLISSGSPV